MINVIHFTSHKDITQLNNGFGFTNAQYQNYFKLIFFKTVGEYVFKAEKIPTIPGKLLFIDKDDKLCNLEQLKGSGWLVLLSTEFLMEALAPQPHQSSKSLPLPSLLKFGEKKIETLNVPSEEQSKWAVRLSSLEEEQNDNQDYCASATRAILKLLLIDLVRLSAKQSEKRLPYSDPLLNQVFDFIESHYFEAISLAEVAKEVNKSTSYLTNIVRQKTGKTVLQWIIEFRMAKARCLLVQTDWSVEKIAEAVGYLDMRHFNRLFGRIHGLSPRKWQSSQLKHSPSDEKANARLKKVSTVLRQGL